MKLGTYLSVSAAYVNRILGVYVMRRHSVLLLNVVRKDATLRLNKVDSARRISAGARNGRSALTG